MARRSELLMCPFLDFHVIAPAAQDLEETNDVLVGKQDPSLLAI